ncbi:MAG: hypothetical protein AMJ94_10950 [Deltaproteobacteria bacterium SM23_61]|nr:MAG: hypothetical protein AMJ94_10950 [Deltaproteobacteria bacterium SM23_61]
MADSPTVAGDLCPILRLRVLPAPGDDFAAKPPILAVFSWTPGCSSAGNPSALPFVPRAY